MGELKSDVWYGLTSVPWLKEAPRRIYVASSWRNPFQQQLVQELLADGHEVYDFRNPAPGNHGFAWSAIDANWLNWTPEAFAHHVQTHPLAEVGFGFDKAALDWCDTCVLVLPCGRSAHLEAGYVSGQGKRVIWWLHEDRFEPELMYRLGHDFVVGKLKAPPAQAHLPDEIRALPADRLREEVWAWRQLAAARLESMMASARASDALGEEDRAIDLRVNFILPFANTLTQHLAGEFHQRCEDCGQPLLHGQQVWPVEDANDVHVACWPGPIIQDGVEIQPYTYSDYYTPASVAATAREALAYCNEGMGLGDEDEEPEQAKADGEAHP